MQVRLTLLMAGVVLLAGCGGFLGSDPGSSPQTEQVSESGADNSAQATPSPSNSDIVADVGSSSVVGESYTVIETTEMKRNSGDSFTHRKSTSVKVETTAAGNITRAEVHSETLPDSGENRQYSYYISDNLVYVPQQSPSQDGTQAWRVMEEDTGGAEELSTVESYRTLLENSEDASVEKEGTSKEIQLTVPPSELQSVQAGIGYSMVLGEYTEQPANITYTVDSETHQIQQIQIITPVKVPAPDGKEVVTQRTTLNYTYKSVDISLPKESNTVSETAATQEHRNHS